MKCHPQISFFLCNCNIIDCPHCGFLHLIIPTEALEIMRANQVSCCLLHRFYIRHPVRCPIRYPFRQHPCIHPVKYRLFVPDITGILIHLSFGIKSCMEPLGYTRNLPDTDIIRQIMIRIGFDLFRRKRGI